MSILGDGRAAPVHEERSPSGERSFQKRHYDQGCQEAAEATDQAE